MDDRRPPTPPPPAVVVPLSVVRAWARSRGFPVGKKGHLHADIILRFNRAHRRLRTVNSNPYRREVGAV